MTPSDANLPQQQLCICLTGTTPELNLVTTTREIHRADLFELRIDYLQITEPFLPLLQNHIDVLLSLGKPVILTARTQADGGNWKGVDEPSRIELLKKLFHHYGNDSRCIFDFEVDSEDLSEFLSQIWVETPTGYQARVIRSFHWFDSNWDYSKAFSKLEKLIWCCQNHSPKNNPWIPKAALNCSSIGQLRDLFLLAREFNPHRQEPLILIGMGEWGMATRILPAWLGSLWSYSTSGAPGDPPPAPGQLDPQTLEEVYGFSRLDGSQKVFGILGNPLAHSKSPVYHNQEFIHNDFPGVYIPLRTDSLEDAMDLAEIIPLEGMSVTIPHKQGVISYLTSWEPGVMASGACNTLVRGPCGWFGVNTDIPGFLGPLESGAFGTPEELYQRVLIVGAGGAARAVVYGILGKSQHITLANRTPERAETLLKEIAGFMSQGIPAQVLPLEEPIEEYFSLIIQTTSLGMDDISDPLPGYTFRGTEVVYDIIYNPDLTPLLARAQSAGCKILNGWPMFVKQAELQNQLFTGQARGIDLEGFKSNCN